MKTSLLRSEPFVMRQIIGSSRLAAAPDMYWGVTAASSTTTPAAFALALAAPAATSSTLAAARRARAATSSSRATRPLMGVLLGVCAPAAVAARCRA